MDFWKIEGVLSGSEGELTPLIPTDRNRLFEAEGVGSTHTADRNRLLEGEGVLSPLTPTDRNRLFEVVGVKSPLTSSTHLLPLSEVDVIGNAI